jgi:hypothetical protein
MSSHSGNHIEIREVAGKKDLRTFIRIPWTIYRNDPNWVPPLLLDRKEAFSSKHPFFRHATWRAWIAWRNGEPIGRISAQIDQLHQDRYRNKTGFFGLIEAPDDHAVFAALFEAAEKWLQENGMQQVIGPFNLGINQEVGILVEGFDTPPRVMSSHSPPYYGPAIEACGYRPEQDMLAYEADIQTYTVPESMHILVSRSADSVKVRPLSRKDMAADFELMRDIFNDAWQNNWNFVPFTREEFWTIGKELLMVIPDNFIQIAEINGEAAAFLVLLPDINEAIADLDGRLLPFGWAKLLWRLKVKFPKASRIPLMGVRQKYQNTIYGPAMAFDLIAAGFKVGRAKGLERVEMSWILESNKGVRNIIEKFGSKITKRYRMYQKSFSFP